MPSAKIENTTPFTTYAMTVTARNAIGWGAESPPVEAQFNFNKASGGTPQTGNTSPDYPGADIVTDYNGTGETWAVHTFKSAGTFTVHAANQPWRVLVVGGGGSGGGTYASYGGGGGAGGVISEDEYEGFEQKDYTVTIGNGGYDRASGQSTIVGPLEAFGGKPQNGQKGGDAAQGDSSQGFPGGNGGCTGGECNGGGGGAGGPGKNCSHGKAGDGGVGIGSTINGVSELRVGGGGGSGMGWNPDSSNGHGLGKGVDGGGSTPSAWNHGPGNATDYTGGGGAGCHWKTHSGGTDAGRGGKGLAIIAYRIG